MADNWWDEVKNILIGGLPKTMETTTPVYAPIPAQAQLQDQYPEQAIPATPNPSTGGPSTGFNVSGFLQQNGMLIAIGGLVLVAAVMLIKR